MQKKRLLYGGIAVAVVIGLVAGAGFLGLRRIPSVVDQVAAAGQISIRIVDPPNDNSYPADAAVPISAIAQSLNPITELEYWVDGRLFVTEPPAPGSSPTFVYQTWKWMPIVEGDHTVALRAKDSHGGSATSNVLRLHADPAAGYRILHTASSADTWENLADDCSTSVKAIQEENSDLDPQQPLPPGQRVWIPCDPIIPSIPAPDQGSQPVPQDKPVTVNEPNKLGLWVNSN